MMLRSVRVRAFRVLEDVHVDFQPGLNVVHGQNDIGKSTLMDAIQTALTVPTRSRSLLAEIRPRSGGEPSIELVFDLAGTRYQLHKRYGSKPQTTLSSFDDGGTPRLECGGEEAEAKLRELLGLTGDVRARRGEVPIGFWRVVWVKQARALGSVASDLEGDGHQTLSQRLAALSGEAMGGADGEAVYRAVEDEFARYFTAQGKEATRADSDLARARTELQEATDAVADLERKATAHAADVDRFARLTGDATEIERRLPELQHARDEATTARDALAKLRSERAVAFSRAEQLRVVRDQAIDRADARKALRDAITKAEATVGERAAAARSSAETLARHDAARAPLTDALASADVARARTERLWRRVRAHAEWLRGQSAHAALERRVSEAREQTERKASAQGRADSIAVTDKALASLERAEKEAERSAMAVDAAAARVRIAAHRPVDVEVGTERLTLAAGEVRELHAASTLSLRVGDLVDVQVTPGGSEIVTLQRKAAEAAQALRSGLSKLGLESVARARAVVEERRTLAAEATAADKVLATIAPDGLFALTRELALSASRQAALQSELLRHSQPDDPALERDAAAAEQSVRDAEATHQAATRAFESAQKAATSHEVARAKLETDAQLAVERVHDAERERDAMGARLRADEQAFGADDVLAQARSAAMERWLEAGRAVETLDASIASVAPDLIDQRAQRTEKAWADAQRELKDTSHQIAEVRGRLQAGDLVGLHERLGRARARNMAADREHARIADRAAAVKLLREVMHDARNTTRRAFLSPLRREVEPLLQVLFDRSALEFDDDFAIREVARGGHGVDTFDKLGGGSREQLEIIVRLAMARVLAGGETLPVMLDDAIVYTSRDRFDRMASVMSLAARSLQVILFTCHWERYRTIGVDHAIDLERLRRDSRP